MVDQFNTALAKVLVHEGGNVDHPIDPGGRTSHGVTQRVYDAWRKGQKQTTRDVWLSTPDERAAIYRAQYWKPIRGDELPAGIGYVVFDGAVNSGSSQSVKWLQRALRMNMIDGHLGEATLNATINHPDHDKLIADICERRMIFLKALHTWHVFGKGWSRRVQEVQKIGQALASGSVGPVPTWDKSGAAKARITDAKNSKVVAPADAAAGAGVVTGGAATAINEAKDALAPIASTSSTVSTIVAILTVAGVVLAIGGLAYRFWAARSNATLIDALDLSPNPKTASNDS